MLVSRISGVTDFKKLKIELDINTDIYDIINGATYHMLIVNTLTNDGAEEFDAFKNLAGGSSGSSLLDQYEYAMHGKVFEDKISENNEEL